LSDLNNFDADSGVYVVEVSENPVFWSVYCEECVGYFAESTQDKWVADEAAQKHRKLHS
jgi:hypothetical protein